MSLINTFDFRSVWRFAAPFLIATCALILGGCGAAVSSGGSSTGLPSTSTGGNTGAGSQPVNVASFNVSVVNATNNPTVTYMHQFGDLAQGCSIPTYTSNGDLNTSAQDISCMVDIREEDLDFYGIQLNVNVPPGLCYYLEQAPYSYFNYEPGYGPYAVEASMASTDAGDFFNGCVTTAQTGVVSTGTVSSDGSRCTASDSTGYFTTDGNFHCAYDYSTNTPAGPNCCLGGTYTGSFTTITAGSSTPTVNPINGAWSGLIGNCLDGAFRDNSWPIGALDNLPETITTNVLNGINIPYVIPSILTTKNPGALSNRIMRGAVFAANMYGWSTYNPTSTTQTAWNAVRANLASLPVALSPQADRAGVYLPPTQESYEYRCVDRAGETLHRIRVYINKWNTDTEFQNYMTAASSGSSSGVLSTTPREGGITGIAGVACTTYGVNVGSYCDNYWAWDDYELNVASNPVATSHSDHFPQMLNR